MVSMNMYFTTLSILFICFCIGICKSVKYMDIFNPYLLFVTPIFIQYVIYLIYYSDYRLKYQSVICIGGTVSFFVLGGILFEITHKPKKRLEYHFIQVNHTVLNVLFIISVLGFFVSLIEMVKTGTSGDMGFFTNIRINEIYGSGKMFFTKYSVVILFFVTLVYFYQYLYERKIGHKNIKLRRKILVLSIMLVVSTLFTVARTELLTYVFALSCVYYYFKGDSIRASLYRFIKKYYSFFFVFMLLVGGFYLLGVVSGRSVTSDIMSKEFFLFRYTGFTLVTFDTYCIDKPGVNGVVALIWPLKKFLNILGIRFPGTSIVPPGTPYNVVGYIGNVYNAVGTGGLIVTTLLIGYFLVCLYNYARERGEFLFLFYASYIYTITISFFAYQYSNTFYLYFLLLIILVKINNRGVLGIRQKGKSNYVKC